MPSVAELQNALARHFDWLRSRCFCNVYFGGGECDFLSVSRAGYATEVEIKRSVGDWNADKLKEKWQSPERRYVKFFYYAVPLKMLDAVPGWVPETAGLIGFLDGGAHCHIRRRALPRVGAVKIADVQIIRLHGGLYAKHWRGRLNA